jgi:hypothetical protein
MSDVSHRSITDLVNNSTTMELPCEMSRGDVMHSWDIKGVFFNLNLNFLTIINMSIPFAGSKNVYPL